MYKAKWDEETNGVILSDKIPDEEAITTSPRPVFYEELDLFRFNKYWKYPKSKKPLLWASGRDYYYRGEKVAKVSGGGYYSKPIFKEIENNLELKPVNIKHLISKNKEFMEEVVNAALNTIKYSKFKEQDISVASFSGGKDSTVVLDLVNRIIPPDEFVVIFNDTDWSSPRHMNTLNTLKKDMTM